jgi:hypothetical protein
MGIDPMTICLREKQTHYLSTVVMQKLHIISFLDSAAVN